MKPIYVKVKGKKLRWRQSGKSGNAIIFSQKKKNNSGAKLVEVNRKITTKLMNAT